jgi:GAF domain-containing protein
VKCGETRLAYGPDCLAMGELPIDGAFYYAAIAAPLRHSGEVTAVLVAADDRPGRTFSELDQEIIERFADYAAIAEHDSELISREQRNLDQIKLLHRLSEAMQTFNDIDDIEMILLTGLTANYGLRFNRAALLMLDPAQSRLVGAHGIGAEDKADWEDALNDYWRNGMEDFDRFLEKLQRKEIPSTWLDGFVQTISLSADSQRFTRFRDQLIQKHVLKIMPNQVNLDLPADLLANFHPQTPLVIIPLLAQGSFVGLVAVDNCFNQTPITEQDCESLLAFGAAGALAIHNAQLLADAEANQKIQETILQAGRRLLSLKDLEQVVYDIVQQAQIASGAMGVTMALIDEPFKVRVIAVAGLDQPENAEKLFRPDGVSRRVMTTGEREIYTDTARYRERLNQAMVTHQMGAALCFPVAIGGQTSGVMWFHYPSARAFREVELDQIQAFVNQAAQAYDNAWQLRQLETITQSAADLTGASETSDILDWIINRVRTALKSDLALALMYDDQNHRFVHGNLLPEDLPKAAWRRFLRSASGRDGTAARVMQAGWLQIPNSGDPAQKELDPATRQLLAACGGQALLGVAMRVGEERLGVIYAIFSARRGLRPRDLKVAQTLAYLAGIALKRARAEKRIHAAYSTARLTAQLSTLGDVNQTLDQLVDGALQSLECDAVTLYTYDQEHDTFGRLPSMAGVRYPEKVLPREVFGPGSRVRRILENGLIYKNENTPRDPRLRGDFSRRERIKATIAVPLKVGETKVGLMFANYRKPHHFTYEEIEDICLFADLAAMATYKGQLVESGEINRRGLLQIHEVSAAWNQVTETKDLLSLITDKLSQVFGGLPASLMQLDETKQHLVIKAKTGVSEAYQAQQKIPAERVSTFLESADPGPFVFDLRQAPFGDPELLQQESLCSALAAPLWAGGNFVGVLNVYTTDQERRFDRTEYEWIRILGNHAAITIQNAANFAHLNEHNRYLGNLTIVEWMKALSHIYEHRLLNDTVAIKSRFDLLKQNIEGYNLDGARKDIQELEKLVEELEELPIILPLMGEEISRPVKVHSFLRDFVEKLEQKTAKDKINIRMVLNQECDSTIIHISQGLLREVLKILTENAIKALRSADKKIKLITYATNIVDDDLEISIQDNGSGIPDEYRASLFMEPIEHENRRGVGLFRIRPLIEICHGKIDCRDTGPDGTTFYFRVPIRLEEKE